jgi:hypothetical protein
VTAGFKFHSSVEPAIESFGKLPEHDGVYHRYETGQRPKPAVTSLIQNRRDRKSTHAGASYRIYFSHRGEQLAFCSPHPYPPSSGFGR